ncbi:MAG: ABC transporter permease [Johnsonella sp.]|nr:ABC transporter permease [Johnsonella sp.]
MLSLLVAREKIRAFYAKYDLFINPLIKFILVLSVLVLIKSNIGYAEALNNPLISVGLALVCSVLPFGGISFVLSLYLLLDVYKASYDMAIILAVMLICIAVLYYGFKPGDSFLLILTPLAFALKIPYAVPLLVGLGGGLLSAIPVSFGVVLYYFIIFIKYNIGTLTNASSVEITQKYMILIEGAFHNKTMNLMMISFIICIVVVYLVRTLSINYAWLVAIVSGIVTELTLIFIGDLVYGIKLQPGELIGGMVLSALIAAIYHFFVFAVDYSHTEYTQFEDDDYYYYVKAVPKIVVATPDRKVQKFSPSKSDKKLQRWGVRKAKSVPSEPKEKKIQDIDLSR